LARRVCLSNLVENAVRYGPAGSTATLRARAGEGAVDLEVEDEGPGIAAAERERVFERFYRGRTSEGVAGAGLGLYVVRTLVRAIGGEITLSAGPGERGTRARLLLPAGADPMPTPGVGRGEPSPGANADA
ncbi:MAG: sensor histidine kinase, partial [Deferrisomatales bacterium]